MKYIKLVALISCLFFQPYRVSAGSWKKVAQELGKIGLNYGHTTVKAAAIKVQKHPMTIAKGVIGGTTGAFVGLVYTDPETKFKDRAFNVGAGALLGVALAVKGGSSAKTMHELYKSGVLKERAKKIGQSTLSYGTTGLGYGRIAAQAVSNKVKENPVSFIGGGIAGGAAAYLFSGEDDGFMTKSGKVAAGVVLGAIIASRNGFLSAQIKKLSDDQKAGFDKLGRMFLKGYKNLKREIQGLKGQVATLDKKVDGLHGKADTHTDMLKTVIDQNKDNGSGIRFVADSLKNWLSK